MNEAIGARLRRYAVNTWTTITCPVRFIAASHALQLCTWCHHFFDATDERAFVYKDSRVCAACSITRLNSREAWALKNNCNGIFDETVKPYRAEAKALLNTPEWRDEELGCYVVPVLIIEEAEDRVDLRNWCENGREKRDAEAA